MRNSEQISVKLTNVGMIFVKSFWVLECGDGGSVLVFEWLWVARYKARNSRAGGSWTAWSADGRLVVSGRQCVEPDYVTHYTAVCDVRRTGVLSRCMLCCPGGVLDCVCLGLVVICIPFNIPRPWLHPTLSEIRLWKWAKVLFILKLSR